MRIPCTGRWHSQISRRSTRRRPSEDFPPTAAQSAQAQVLGLGSRISGASYDEVVHTVINAVAIISGMVCDGAKASCAAKIAEAVDAGIIGYYMAKRGQNFDDGDGIVTAGSKLRSATWDVSQKRE